MEDSDEIIRRMALEIKLLTGRGDARILRSRYRAENRDLDLSGLDLPALPMDSLMLLRPQSLSLGKNPFQNLPESLFDIVDLQRLEIKDGNISTISNQMCKLENLAYLDLRNNQLTCFPPVTSLSNLRVLNLSGNQIREIPSSILDLSNLETLVLSHNKLVDLPLSLAQMVDLKILHIVDQCFDLPPKKDVIRILETLAQQGTRIYCDPFLQEMI